MQITFQLARYFMALALFSLFLNMSLAQSVAKTETVQTIQGIPCQGEIKYFDTGKIQSCYLSNDFKIEEFDLPAGTQIFFNQTGKLVRFIAKKTASICGQVFPAKTIFFPNAWGEKLAFWLPVDTKIQGHQLGARKDGIGDFIYLNGKLRAIWLVDDEVIDEVPCTSSLNIFKYGLHVITLGTERMVNFYDNGQIEQAMLSRDYTIQGHGFHKGQIIHFDKEGNVIQTSK